MEECKETIHKGWQCPICKRVMAPWVRECSGNHEEQKPLPVEIPIRPEVPVYGPYEKLLKTRWVYNPGPTCGTDTKLAQENS
jgi:hypothetical protein